MSRYLETIESIEEKLELLQSLSAATESPSENKNFVQVDNTELNSMKNSLNMSVTSFVSEIDKLDKVSECAAIAMEALSSRIRGRIDQLRFDSRQLEPNERQAVMLSCDQYCTQLDSALLQICKKVKREKASTDTVSSSSLVLPKHSEERVHLEKSKPPEVQRRYSRIS